MSRLAWSRWLSVVVGLSSIHCGAVVPLQDETRVSPYQELVAQDRKLSERRYRLRLQEPATESGLEIEVRELGAHHVDSPVIVLLNGVFSDGRTWRFLTGLLAEHHRVLVLDLPGTGQSSIPDPSLGGSDRYTPGWLARATTEALLVWQRSQPKPIKFVLVGHSIAGTVVLRMLGDRSVHSQRDQLNDSVAGAVLIAPADITTAAWSPTLVELAELSDWEVRLGAALGILEDRVETAIYQSVVDPSRSALRGEALRMVENLLHDERRRASQAMLLRIRPLDTNDEPRWAEISKIASVEQLTSVPVVLIWGRQDDALPLSTAHALAQRLATSELRIVEQARHSVHQEAPFETSRIIVDFIATRVRAD